MKGENTLSETTLKARLKHATKTEAEWKTANPVLLEGEVAYSSDKRQQKTGDGTSTWSALSYDSAIPTSHEHNLSAMINKLGVGEATPTDNDYYVSQYVGGGTTTTSYHRRPMSALFEYIKSKFGTAATKNISDFASAKHNHNIESLTNFNQRVYDAASTRKKGTFLAAPATADGTASFRTLAETDVTNALGYKPPRNSTATTTESGLMSANDYIDLQSAIEELKALKKLKEYDGGSAKNAAYENELDGGGAGTSYALEQTDFVVTLAANKWVQNGSMFTQSVVNSKISGLNDYLIGTTLTGSESQSVATSYNTNFAYITTGSSSGSTLTINALKKPAIDLSVRVIKI